jgi:hypothetical protein
MDGINNGALLRKIDQEHFMCICISKKKNTFESLRRKLLPMGEWL